MTKDSNIDLLVVESEPPNTFARSVQLRNALGDVGYPVDVIVMRTERFERMKRFIGGMLILLTSTVESSMKRLDPDLESLVRAWI